MTEQLKLFIQQVQSSEDLKSKLEELEKSVEGKEPEAARSQLIPPIIQLAKECGCDLTESDFEMPTGELSDEELDAIAGGVGGCGCIILGGGGGKNEWIRNHGGAYVCACVALGSGMTNDVMKCGCFFYGSSDM